jgi:O-antigen/teichoic acid export membrane protein
LAQPDLPSSTQFGLLALIVAAPLYTLFQVELAHAQIAFIPGRILLLSAAPVLVDFVASAIFLAAGRFTIQAVVIVALTAEASRLFLSLHLRRRDRRIDVCNSSARHDLAQVAAFWPDSLKFSVPSAAPIIASNIDVLILGIFVRPAQLGIYAVAKIGFNLTQLAGQAIEGRALVNLRNGPRAKEFRATLGAFVVLASLIALAGAAAVLTLFPDSFSPAAPIVPALVLAGVVFTIIRWVVASLATEGGNARLSWYSSACILGSSVLAPAAIMFMPDRGVTSMALLALAAQLASAASTAVLVRFVAARQRVSS